MANDKLGLPSKERLALIRNQVSHLLWYGKLETTAVRARSVRSKAEKMITLAMNSYEDTVKAVKTITDDKGVKTDREVLNDGPKKLTARRAMMAFLYDLQEQKPDKESKTSFKARTLAINHPLIEKMFNVYAPKYDARAKELGTRGGYTRIIKLNQRRGDAAQLVKIELV